MKKTIASLAVASILLSGCATTLNTLGSKEAFAACKTLDVVTTTVALKTGAVEANPLMAGLIHPIGITGFVALSAGLVWLVWHYEKEIPKEAIAVGTVISCAAGANNIAVIK